MLVAKESSAASGPAMGVVVVEESGAGNPATKTLEAEALPLKKRQRLKKSSTQKKKRWRRNASASRESEATSGYSTRKSTQTVLSANYSGQ
jgi:hypothetical protein